MGVKNEERYRGKLILAPMVRIGTLPMRLLALDYGADLVYCEEIIDRKILMSHRHENELLGTTDFVTSDGTIVFRTCPREKEQLIFQIGTNDGKRALAAAKKIEDCVAGVDVNMGCPKEFSVKGGMGAALLTKPDQVKLILTTLVNGLSVPVTCKIRCLPKLEDTIELVRLIESTGVSAIGVHGRTIDERPKDPNRNHFIKAVAESVSIPVIANGGSKAVTSRNEIEKFIEETGASSAMMARAAEWNCSVFRRGGPLDLMQVVREYLHYAFQFDNNAMNTKYCVLQMLHDRMTEVPEADGCLSAKSLEDFANIWKMKEWYEKVLSERRAREAEIQSRLSDHGDYGVKRRKLDNGAVYIELPVKFDRHMYSKTVTPKQTLNNWIKSEHLDKAVYDTMERAGDRCFNSQVTFKGKVYSNPYWVKSKQLAEQSAAMACLLANGKDDGRVTQADQQTEELHQKWLRILEMESERDGQNSPQAQGPDCDSETEINDKVTNR